ncbi:MAG: hypothetical protein A2521_08100 [Deltaproteobacteria bacterium RIFOXYD12_FULL_57_12]|nr:MAG: hypothetical protein A2521_08100 [Deltaproteobacteria bacterium RIFOXYD12_FULL_57_12]
MSSNLTTPPYVITRIRLINFHNFVDETISLPAGGHLFLLGDNGCGKTTILDAVHFVLTAGLGMEWNAAARVAGSKREGRRVQGIVLRYNLDTGILNREGGISYAALEIAGRHGQPLTIGVGLAATAMEEQIQQWGVIRECPLEEISFLIEDEQGRRPASRLEFKERPGPSRGYYRDAKAYRTELASRLFDNPETYLEVCRFLAMGKAYREIASHAADYHELFKSLLPEPKTELFERIIEALRTLDESKSILDDLERKLLYLRELQTFVDTIRDEREAVLRYEWLRHQMTAEIIDREISTHQEVIGNWQAEETELARQLREEQLAEAILLTRLDDLKGLDASGLVRQEKDCRAELERKGQSLNRVQTELEEQRKSQRLAEQDLGRLRESLRQDLKKMHREMGRRAGQLPFSLSPLMTAVDEAFRAGECEDLVFDLDCRSCQEAADTARDELLRQRTLLEQTITANTEAQDRLGVALTTLRKNEEALPNLTGFPEAMAAMTHRLLNPLPLYRGLEWKPGLSRQERGRIEETIGEEIIATILLSEKNYTPAREVATEFPGIRITHPGRGLAELPDWMRQAFDIAASQPEALRCLAAEMAGDYGPLVTTLSGRDLLAHRSHERGLFSRPARLIGVAGRRETWQAEIRTREKELHELEKQGRDLEKAARAMAESLEPLDSFRLFLPLQATALQQLARQIVQLRQQASHCHELVTRHEEQLRGMRQETSGLSDRLRNLVARIREEDLADLDRRITALQKKMEKQRETVGQILKRQAEKNVLIREEQKKITQARLRQEKVLQAWDSAARRLAVFLPPEQEVAHYVLRSRKGFQFKTVEAVEKEQANSDRTVQENRAVLKERLNNPEFGAAFRFSYEEEANEIYDFRSRRLADLITQQARDITEQQEIINERTKELFKKIIMTELVNYLRSHVSDLERMVGNIRRLLAERSFGGQQYRFRITPLDTFRRLVAVIKKFSPFDPAGEEEIRHFFEDHKEAIINTEVGRVPDELDYRNWYRYEMEVVTTGDTGVVMDRRTKSMGSGGEQAVPNYLLILTIAHFLYHGKKAKLHAMLFDEAFYGIDAGRRDQLLGFATDLGLQLMVASPDQDGVRQEIDYSTTIVVKKDTNLDVHLYPLHWENPDITRQTGLFEAPRPKRPLVFGEEI